MNIFLHMQGVPAEKLEIKIYKKNGFNLIPCEYNLEGRFYMVVMMESGDYVLLVLYNSAAEPDEAEAAILGNIINSIRFSAKGN
jgi:hypothetical protein